MAQIWAYKDWMSIHNHQDEAMCKGFPLTLVRIAYIWYIKLKPHFIDNFDELSWKFVTHFLIEQVKSKSTDSLFSIKQGPGESLLSYTKKFHAATLGIDKFQETIALNAF